jgi:hypothetical protein
MNDLARWVAVNMEGGVIDGKRVFPAEAVALSHRLLARQTREETRSFGFFRRDGWAAGWDIGSYRGEAMVSRFGAFGPMRSHLSFLPARRIGVVAQANGNPAWEATDILAAFAYDLERGDPVARTRADERLRRLMDERRQSIAEKGHDDSVRAARRPTLRHALSDFAGSYRNPAYGTVSIDVRGGTVHYKWGAVEGVARVLEASSCWWSICRYDNALLIEVANAVAAMEFDFPDHGPATALTLRGERFVRQ